MTNEERQTKLAQYKKAYKMLKKALKRYPREMWQFRAEPDRWTIHEIVVHITDSEANSFTRCRRAIAEPGLSVMAYDEVRWAKVLNYHELSTKLAVKLFKYLRKASYDLIKDLSDEVWANTIDHPENGVMTLDDWLDVYARHIPEHIEQMDKVYATWQEQHEM